MVDLVPAASRAVEPSFRLGQHSDVLSAIREPSVNVAIWQRTIPAAVRKALLHWAKQSDFDFEQSFQVGHYDLGKMLVEIEDAATRAYLEREIPMLLQLLAKVSRSRRLLVSFGAVKGDQCRKFHYDYVRVRLVTTLVGPGTEWLSDAAVRRDGLDLPWECVDEANGRIVRSSEDIKRVRAGDVLLMKGARYPGASEKTAAIHRSPPIEESGESRVVLIATAR